MMRGYIKALLILLVFPLLSSCVALPTYEKVSTIPRLPKGEEPAGYRSTITHEVGPGETTWRISKMYDVDIEDIARANNLRDASKLEMGQRIIVPNAAPMSAFIPLYPSRKWKYIIVHHSATEIGNALTLYRGHKRRGFINGLGYHFLIDNGTAGKSDGQIEISPRWIKQQKGAHCKVANMNSEGIGICLVGNLSKRRPTEKQMESLIALINTLKRRYRIPVRNILGHGQVKGARTECPGKLFPWKIFYDGLKRNNKELKSVKGEVG
ncbi:MAG: N-acetylmuramoyl-L-alanine amidase [Candidatus Omnitrophica bacterium]|nr:N-acetylmuramoyl-L-alanine amidase [Candidatus Omnitrophota bacterium]